MNVKVFDTHVRTLDGGYLHFDVLIEGNDQTLATRHAREWLASRGVADADVSQSRCQFCHSEPAHPDVAAAIAQQGYFIIPLQGC
ncbi:DUF2024 family protein [Aquipseudomonas guryensis]|jgi:hypothetical protein|uniref:DUF2024 family protein n=1 Tax=Aquipseudomonas guryensis TaxID=2759165 RepID=A0A7W4DE43_9GAMM|nr:DUF2024 family protein [Pseudomonas guryensis]MBB1520597.1 DUF2024 family protein [Pseudomonas guryensis]